MVQQIRNFFYNTETFVWTRDEGPGGGGGQIRSSIMQTSATAFLKAETRARHRREFHTEMTT